MALSMHLILLSVPLGEVKTRPLRNKSNLTMEKDSLGYSWTKWIGRDLCGLLDLSHPISVSTDEKKLVPFVLTFICTDRMVLSLRDLLAHPHQSQSGPHSLMALRDSRVMWHIGLCKNNGVRLGGSGLLFICSFSKGFWVPTYNRHHARFCVGKEQLSTRYL